MIRLGKKTNRWLRSIRMSETGLVRRENQDSFFVGSLSWVYCVADGMGGGEEGARASEIVCDEVYRAVSKAGNNFAARMEAVECGLQEANSTIYNHAKAHGYRQMGSTAAVLVFDEPGSNRGAVCYVGDSRIYRVRAGLAAALTQDHSVGAELSRRAKPGSGEEFSTRSHPLSHILTRAIGTDVDVRTEWRKIDVEKGDRFVICSDGVHDVVNDSRLGFLVGYDSLEDAKSRLAAEVVRGGAPDNFTFILVEVGEDK